MKKIILIFLFIFFVNIIAQNEQQDVPVIYDSLLAKQLGADDFGMKKYVMAFLKAGSVKIDDTVKKAELQKAHLNNIIRLADEGKLIIAGPFIDNKEIRGIFIFDVETIEEAKELTETDPAIKAGTLSMELFTWYGPAALPLIIDMNKKIQKKSIVN